MCETTRTTISALRIGDYLIGTLPGELTVMLATELRSKSPVDEGHTILVGYAQGHVGYMLRPEDWLMGGYEPSVTFWGPLGAEAIGERLLALLPLALTATRQARHRPAARTASPRVRRSTGLLPIDNPAPGAGTIPDAIPASTWARTGHPTQAQPQAQVPRVVEGIAQFIVWIGDDPQTTQTPHVHASSARPPRPARSRRSRGAAAASSTMPRSRSRTRPTRCSAAPARRPTSGSPSGRRCRGSARPASTRSTIAAACRSARIASTSSGKGWTLDS